MSKLIRLFESNNTLCVWYDKSLSLLVIQENNKDGKLVAEYNLSEDSAKDLVFELSLILLPLKELNDVMPKA